MTPYQQELAQACTRYRLNRFASQARGEAGSLVGRRQGSSVEFHDFRKYVPGDDPRHVDWAVYGRTGELTLRLFREEIEPHVELLVDGSRSMSIDDGNKAQLARLVPDFFRASAHGAGCSSRLQLVGTGLKVLPELGQAQLDAPLSLLSEAPQRVAQSLRRGALTYVFSDFLTQTSPHRLLTALSERSSRLCVVMLLGPWEAAPQPGAMHRLVDHETGQELSTVLSREVLARYQARLSALKRDVQDTCRLAGASFVSLVCDRSLLKVLEDDFLPRQLVLPT